MNLKRTAVLHIQTPEGITFTLRLAGPVTRFIAWFFDLLVVAGLSIFINIAFRMLAIISIDIAMAVYSLAYFIISIGYGIFTEWYWNGQTVGKKLLRLRVMDVQGLHLKFHQIVLRNLLRFVDSLPIGYLIGGSACFFSPKAQRIGDMAANTIVVWIPDIAAPDLTRALADKYNSFRKLPHLAARLRQKISPAEAESALQALLRRDQLNPAARVELFRRIADHFRRIVPFPQETVEGISDEQYVRNVVDVLYNDQSKLANKQV